MPAIASLSIADGLGTPVSRGFAPVARYPITVWEYLPAAYPYFTGAVRLTLQGATNPKTGLHRGRFTVAVPLLDVDGKVMSVSRFNLESIHAAESTAGQRNDAFAFFLNGVNNTTIRPVVRDRESMF